MSRNPTDSSSNLFVSSKNPKPTRFTWIGFRQSEETVFHLFSSNFNFHWQLEERWKVPNLLPPQVTQILTIKSDAGSDRKPPFVAWTLGVQELLWVARQMSFSISTLDQHNNLELGSPGSLARPLVEKQTSEAPYGSSLGEIWLTNYWNRRRIWQKAQVSRIRISTLWSFSWKRSDYSVRVLFDNRNKTHRVPLLASGYKSQESWSMGFLSDAELIGHERFSPPKGLCMAQKNRKEALL